MAGRWRTDILIAANRLNMFGFWGYGLFGVTTQISVVFCDSKFWNLAGKFAASIKRPKAKCFGFREASFT